MFIAGVSDEVVRNGAMLIQVFPYAYGRVCVDEPTSAAGMTDPLCDMPVGIQTQDG